MAAGETAVFDAMLVFLEAGGVEMEGGVGGLPRDGQNGATAARVDGSNSSRGLRNMGTSFEVRYVFSGS